MQPDGLEEAFDVLVVGGGNAGLSVAARLLRRGVSRVAVIEPLAVHTYRPLLSYVGAGQVAQSSAERTQESVTPRGCIWLQDAAVSVHTDTRTVQGRSGRAYRYNALVLATGLVPDEEALPGIDEAINSPAVASNYLDHAEKTWELVRSLSDGGRAVFTVPRPPVSCTGTTYKPLFLAAAHWWTRMVDVDITLVVDRPSLLGVPEIDDRLQEHLDGIGVHVLYDATVTAVKPDGVEVLRDNASQTVPFDFLHLVPPFRGPRWLEECGLTAADSPGLVDVDSRTFRHRRYRDVWAVGDAATVDTDPSGGALRKQTAILVDNMEAARDGGPMTEYDGYTVAPIATDAHRLMFGEFDRSGVTGSLPLGIDPLTPRRAAWAFDRYALPQMYWNLILKGLI
ncbi:NAD(P)/FAD-dependent oxidoreductase [Mycolicibacterium arenosum]|uniref:NAD(P)/FAD-dependent oxidoreductase n=1 Tax=Mycolicibacterium arenosum TaxID=2952157 RepID=A0ABT1M4K1_9MYCO|nr:FAD/NAD(P)-binding oxidoreductase [Mycolicibacterium sp. CAU 1645]MCP9274090.1 NAD(P)/FAD-dependent oxidoreductase [Mycolicibacterium sp. CAU 1645]